jgi:hypothetical protein
MRLQQKGTPGTVSRILWHFTGGPLWDTEKKRQRARPKNADDAYAALVSILKTKALRLGQYRECVVAKYRIRKVDPKTKETTFEPKEKVFESAQVCCVADIPIAHLAYHSHRYGKFAIGFHRDAIVRQKFSPVFYSLHDAAPLQYLRRGISSLNSIAENAEASASDVWSFEHDAKCEEGHPLDDTYELSEFKDAFESIEKSAQHAREELEHSLAFLKTFSQSEFSTVYCEREWRSVKEFAFELNDVAMIVLPRRIADQSFFDSFVKQNCRKLPRSIPVVPWEDLIEH